MRFRKLPFQIELENLPQDEAFARLETLWKGFRASEFFQLLVHVLRDLESTALEGIRQYPTEHNVENAMVLHVVNRIRRRIESYTADQGPLPDWYDDEDFLVAERNADGRDGTT